MFSGSNWVILSDRFLDIMIYWIMHIFVKFEYVYNEWLLFFDYSKIGVKMPNLRVWVNHTSTTIQTLIFTTIEQRLILMGNKISKYAFGNYYYINVDPPFKNIWSYSIICQLYHRSFFVLLFPLARHKKTCSFS